LEPTKAIDAKDWRNDPPRAARPSVLLALLPILTTVLIAFLVIGMALPVLPLHVHDGLGFGALMVGVLAGSQFVVSLFSRVWSGRTSDDYGPKRTVIVGLAAGSVAGLLYFLSLQFTVIPKVRESRPLVAERRRCSL
jgi:MFS family permease